MQDVEFNMAGIVSYFKLAKQSSRSALAEGFTDALGNHTVGLNGLGLEEYVPEIVSDKVALRQAIDTVFSDGGKNKKLIVKSNNHLGYSVSYEDTTTEKQVGDSLASVEYVCRLRLNSDKTLNPFNPIEVSPRDYGIINKLETAFEEAKRYISQGACSAALVEIAVKHFGGVCLREAGGIYWVLQEHLEDWGRVAKAFEMAAAAANGSSKVYCLQVKTTPEMIEAVGDALAAEVEKALAEIEEELNDVDHITERVCINRVSKCSAIEAKVRSYEDAFRRPLTELKEKAERTAQAVAIAQISLGAAQSPLAAVEAL